jgi:hypothetical protein
MTELKFGDAVGVRALADVLAELNPGFATEFGEGYSVVSWKLPETTADEDELP